MEINLVRKMITNCFKQYYEQGSIPLSEKNMDELITKILQTKKEEPSADFYEIVNDMVYEFLSN